MVETTCCNILLCQSCANSIGIKTSLLQFLSSHTHFPSPFLQPVCTQVGGVGACPGCTIPVSVYSFMPNFALRVSLFSSHALFHINIRPFHTKRDSFQKILNQAQVDCGWVHVQIHIQSQNIYINRQRHRHEMYMTLHIRHTHAHRHSHILDIPVRDVMRGSHWLSARNTRLLVPIGLSYVPIVRVEGGVGRE